MELPPQFLTLLATAWLWGLRLNSQKNIVICSECCSLHSVFFVVSHNKHKTPQEAAFSLVFVGVVCVDDELIISHSCKGDCPGKEAHSACWNHGTLAGTECTRDADCGQASFCCPNCECTATKG